MNSEIYEELNAVEKNLSNDQTFGAEARKIIRRYRQSLQLKSQFEKLSGLSVDMQSNGRIFRFGYWEQPETKVVEILITNGFEIDIFDDEDCGQKICYILKNSL